MLSNLNDRLWIFLVINLFFFFHCKNVEHKNDMSLDLASNDVAVYKVTPQTSSKAPKKSKQNKILTDNQIVRIFQSVKIKKNSLLKVKLEDLFPEKTIYDLLPYVKDATFNPGKIYFIVIRKDDLLQPYLRFYRTSFYLWRQKNLHLYFTEIESNFIYQTQYTFQDWSQVSNTNFECSRTQVLYPARLLATSFSFSHKDNVCNTAKQKTKSQIQFNYNHLLIHLNKIDYEENSEYPFDPNQKNAEIRLEELERLYKKGLINEKEYNLKRKKILEEL